MQLYAIFLLLDGVLLPEYGHTYSFVIYMILHNKLESNQLRFLR